MVIGPTPPEELLLEVLELLLLELEVLELEELVLEELEAEGELALCCSAPHATTRQVTQPIQPSFNEVPTLELKI